MIPPPDWVEVDDNSEVGIPNRWDISSFEHVEDLRKLRHKDCRCCVYCLMSICDPNTVTETSCVFGCEI